MAEYPDSSDHPEVSDVGVDFERLIADLSSRFINLPPGEVDRGIEAGLRRVCELLGIDYSVLWQWSDTPSKVLKPTHFYPREGGEQPSEPMDQDLFPWALQEVMAGRVVAVSSLDEIPVEGDRDRETCLHLGIKSNLTLPLAVGGKPLLGALGFNTVQEERDWPDAVVKRLILIGQVFSNALARKRHELDLLEKERTLAMAVDSAKAGLWALDLRTGTFWASDQAREIFGFAADEVISLERLKAKVHPDDWDLVQGAIEQSVVEGGPLDVVYRIVLPGGGRPRWISSRGRLQRSATGEAEKLMGISFDDTRRRRDLEALSESEVRLRAGSDLAGLAFYEVDFDKGLASVDDRLRDILGLPPEVEGGLQALEYWLEHLHPDDRPKVLEARDELHDGKVERISIEYRFPHLGRSQRWIRHEARVSERDATGRAVKSFGVLRDITSRRVAEENLRRSYEEISRLKDRIEAERDHLSSEIRVIHQHIEVIGTSSAIREALQQVEQVAPLGTSVLIYGETGTGKELIARAIHRLSPRTKHLMVKVNCAALPTGLLESELFGREKGAYTGALTRQIGRFEIADGSTLFLDEVGELPLELQGKLLRVLETGEFERLGNPRVVKVDVRVIAATNRDLSADIGTGRFREDLYYRLRVFPIRVPPLRERVEDIPQLVWSFLQECSSRMGKKITDVPRETMDALQRNPWPGNVRELKNVIEHGAIISQGPVLRIPLLDGAPSRAAPTTTLAEAEREHILRVLERSGWRIKGPGGAAELLGLNPATLYSRMKKLGLRRGQPTKDSPA